MRDDIVRCNGITNVNCPDTCSHAVSHEIQDIGDNILCTTNGHCSTLMENVACEPIIKDSE